MKFNYQITEFCHRFLEAHIEAGDICVDATAGKGNDTEFLRRLTGSTGKVYAFDIQEQAVDYTRKRLEDLGMDENVFCIHAGHEKMREFVREEVSAIVFNFGYLPGGDHKIATNSQTSIKAIEEGQKLLKKGGIMSLCIYSGQDTGYDEKEAVLAYLKGLDSKKWLVILSQYYNRENDPPIPAFLIRLK